MDEISVANRFLITGAQGFVGRFLAAHLLENEPDCRVLGTGRSARNDDTFTHSIALGETPFPAPVPGPCRIASEETRYRYQQSDLLTPGSLEPLLRDFKPNSVVHLASGLRGDPDANLFRTNVEGTINLLESIGRAGGGLPLVIYGSSGGVYGRAGDKGVGLSEEDPCEPIDMYSVSKLAAEHAARVVSRQYRIPILYVRLFNLVGPGQDERHVCGRFASKVVSMKQGLAEKRFTVGALGTTRDFLDVRDVVRSRFCQNS